MRFDRSGPFAAGLALGAAVGVAATSLYLRSSRIDPLEQRVAALEAESRARSQAAAPQRERGERARVEVRIEGAPIRGAQEAPITLVEFSDFACPYCASAQPALERLLAEYPDAVRLVFRHRPLPSHARAPLAHKAALAAGRQGRFWEMHDRIFENPRDLGRSALLGHAEALGLDRRRFERDLDDPELERILEREKAEALRLAVHQTPTFFLNGRRIRGALDYEELRAQIERELAAAGVTLGQRSPPSEK